MAGPPSTGMEKAEMRRLLMQTKEKPVHCAIGVGKDMSVGLLVLDRMKAPKMLEKQLIDSLPDAKNTRWGTAVVDWENDAKLVKLFLNKPISGMARRLVKTIKGTGFTKIQIMMEDGTPVEGAADEEEDEAAATAGAEAAPATSANGEAATDAPPPPAPPPPPAEAQAPALDAAELTRRLAALAPRIPAVAGDNAERKAELLKLASLGNVNIKTNNLTYAATYIGQLERALSAAPPPPPPPPPASAAAQDGSGMARELAALIPRIAQIADPAQKAELAKLANMVNVNIKTNNLTYAATYLAQLRTGLDRAAGAPAAAGAIDFAAQAKAWTETCRGIEADLGRLRAAIVGAYAGQPFAGEIAAKFDARTGTVLDALGDQQLGATLSDAATASDAQVRAGLVGRAGDLLGALRTRAADPLLADLDTNPFLPLSLQATLSASLDRVAAALR